MNTAPISIRLPEEANMILDTLANELHITKTQLIKEAILERIEDYLDSKTIDKAICKRKKTYSMAEIKARHGLED
ncbi:MAG: RHH-type transcriptional regulator, rel operon repressor / antitoxin RelB [Pseudomonadota bacterium]|nr:RHH-type transcriptional regulator, rel operon repressor / antitoxin RelB [Pseudomonadota bacterium]